MPAVKEIVFEEAARLPLPDHWAPDGDAPIDHLIRLEHRTCRADWGDGAAGSGCFVVADNGAGSSTVLVQMQAPDDDPDAQLHLRQWLDSLGQSVLQRNSNAT
jgi:hypothetical protein